MGKNYVDDEVMDISEVEKKVLLVIHKIVEQTNLFARRSSLQEKLDYEYGYLGMVLLKMKREGLIVAPRNSSGGRYKPSKKALAWIRKTQTKRRKK